MINFMAKGVEVRGTLTKTNRPDILEQCLQTTIPILADPVRKEVYYKKDEENVIGHKLVDIEKLKSSKYWENFIHRTVTKDNFDAFITRVENNVIGKGTKGKK